MLHTANVPFMSLVNYIFFISSASLLVLRLDHVRACDGFSLQEDQAGASPKFEATLKRVCVCVVSPNKW